MFATLPLSSCTVGVGSSPASSAGVLDGGDRAVGARQHDAVARHVARAGAVGADAVEDQRADEGGDRHQRDDDAALDQELVPTLALLLLLAEHPCLLARSLSAVVTGRAWLVGAAIGHR
ncbi:hypothetical protein ACGGZK_09250 [Agromyces sp. MMS24-K17]|uniref:hypothetical protein n=1 Tax=Agromyces sp. MMS24-K17 TaxID=3372850 RepID=UPI003753FB17